MENIKAIGILQTPRCNLTLVDATEKEMRDLGFGLWFNYEDKDNNKYLIMSNYTSFSAYAIKETKNL